MLTRSVARELILMGHTVRVFTGHPSDEFLNDDARLDTYDYEGMYVYRFHHAYTPMAGQQSMIEIGYDNHLAACYFEKILNDFAPDIVHFFHLNRLGTGLIEKLSALGIPGFLTPTDFWTICATGQLVYANGSLCEGPSAASGNCVKHFAQNGNRSALVSACAKCLPTPVADLVVRLTLQDALPTYPQALEVKAIGARLPVNIERLNKLKTIFAPNRFMKDKLLAYGVKPELIAQSEFGVDVPAAMGIRVPRSADQVLRVGFIGTLAQHKGCHILIKAFNALPARQATLKIYGSHLDFPEYYTELKSLSGERKDIEFCGVFPNSQISEVMANLDVLVVPSLWYENTPLVLYSAAASSCPVIASDFPGISAAVEHQVNGLLFEAGNVLELRSRILDVIHSRSLLSKLADNARPPKSLATYVGELLQVWTEAVI